MYRSLGIIVLLLTISSCRKLVQGEFYTPPHVPVINSILIPGKPVEVHASFSANINASNIETVEDADITLYINGVFVENLVHQGNSLYASATSVEEGKTYKCEVLIPEYETVICSDSIPKTPVVIDIEHINEAGRNEEGTTFPAIRIAFANDTSTTQYFEVAIRLLAYGEEKLADLERITDPVLIEESLSIALFSNQLINDTVYQLTLNYITGSESASNGIWHTDLFPLIIEFRSVSYDYYQYAKSAYLYEEGRYPDGLASQTSVFNTHSNVENAYGIFSGYSVFQSDTIYPNHLEIAY